LGPSTIGHWDGGAAADILAGANAVMTGANAVAPAAWIRFLRDKSRFMNRSPLLQIQITSIARISILPSWPPSIVHPTASVGALFFHLFIPTDSRDTHWDTVASEFKRVDMTKTADSFRISLSAVTRRVDSVDYAWEAAITGTPEGQITYDVHGKANSDFVFNRFGLCVHFGEASLAGQKSGTLHSLPDANLLISYIQCLHQTFRIPDCVNMS